LLRVAARGSLLSRIQVQMVSKPLADLGMEVEFIPVKSRADLNPETHLRSLGRGAFEAEVNAAVLRGEAEIAVHSMKDLPTDMDERLHVLGVLKRDSPLDAILPNNSLRDLEPGSRVGTSSERRANFVLFSRPDLKVTPIRGNVDTRVNKQREGLVDALILAEASIVRLGLNVNYGVFDPTELTPEANQGAVALVSRVDFKPPRELLSILDETSLVEVKAEREVVREVGGGCSFPLGVLFRSEGNYLMGIASYITPKLKITVEGRFPSHPLDAGRSLSQGLRRAISDAGAMAET